MEDTVQQQEMIQEMRKLPREELLRMLASTQLGTFHLRQAIEAFEGLGHETDPSDLQGFLEEAEEAEATILKALGDE